MSRQNTPFRWQLVRHLVSNLSRKNRKLVSGKYRPKGSLRSRFLQNLFEQDGEREALRTIYASLQLQYGQVEEKLHSLYSSLEPAIDSQGRPRGELEIENGKKANENHEIIEFDNETEEAEVKLREEELRVASQFVNGLTWFAKRSGFKACSMEDEMYAKENHYRLTTPMKIDWSYFDDRILKESDPYARRFEDVTPPSFSKRALLLVRGSGNDSTTGFYYTEKFDELTTRFAQRSYASATNRVRNILGMEKHERQMTFVKSRTVAMWSKGKPQMEKLIQTITGDERTSMASGKAQGVDDMNYGKGGETNLTNSVTNNNALSEIEFTFSNLVGRIKLEEETFKDALVVYGTAGYPDPEIRKKDDFKKYVSLRHFKHVPRCDMEFVLPDTAQKVYMRPVDRLFLAMSIIGGTGVASTVFFTGVALTKPGVIAMTALGAYVVRIFNRYRMSKFYYRSAMAQYLNNNATGKDRSVVYIVTKESRDNDFVAIASVLNAAWEFKDDQTSFKALLENRFRDGKDASSKESHGVVINIEELHSRAKDYFMMAESIKHDDGLDDPAFNNAISWLSRMGIIEVQPDRSSISMLKTCDEIIGMKRDLLANSLDENITMYALNAGFLQSTPEHSDPE